MSAIDDQGRLFGIVNVVDLLVVLLVLAVLVAGVALVTGGSDPDRPTRYATISYSAPMNSDAAQLTIDESLTPTQGSDRFAVTDVHRSFASETSVYVVARIAYVGELTYGGNRLYGGDSMTLAARSYRVNADVVAVNESGDSLTRQRVPVVLAVTSSAGAGAHLREGQPVTIANRTVATIASVTERDGRVLVGVELRAWNRPQSAVFGGKPLRIGQQVSLVTDELAVTGEVRDLGTATPGEA